MQLNILYTSFEINIFVPTYVYFNIFDTKLPIGTKEFKKIKWIPTKERAAKMMSKMCLNTGRESHHCTLINFLFLLAIVIGLGLRRCQIYNLDNPTQGKRTCCTKGHLHGANQTKTLNHFLFLRRSIQLIILLFSLTLTQHNCQGTLMQVKTLH